ncbi:MAG TPA: recombinase family protein [Phycisphaerales bacterium]|nr:recombinase family protein [Phycisphaerales bacterium]
MTTVGNKKAVRCAVYCRVSNDDGLSQAFTSLDAQRASGEAFVQAHQGEGWRCLPERFEDGGYSGGTLERPALQRLLEQVEAGEVDVICVYKLDRLTRSIRDFGTLAGVLEKKHVAIVSVTQSIDTGTSMGRLMMHVLLSFAAFERELASERTRDKIALTRQRGQWSGGRPPLGYDIANPTLVVNEPEAVQVRLLYGKYLEIRSLSKLIDWASERGIKNKRWTSRSGESLGGCAFVKSTMAQLLSNPVYIGRVPHKGTTYPGLHPAIVDAQVFKRVQELLAENGRAGPSRVRNKFGGILKGVLRCGRCGGAMVHGVTRKNNGIEHRYYSCLTKQAYGARRCAGGAVPAAQIERFVIDKVRDTFADPLLVGLVLDAARERGLERIRDLEARQLALAAEQTDLAVLRQNSAAVPPRGHHDVLRDIEAVRAAIEEERAALVDRPTTEMGLKQFDSVWATLSPKEQSQVVALTLERVTFDAAAGEIKITPHSAVPQEAAA